MDEPKSLEEYNARFASHQKIDGFGIDITVSMPCPFCAAPNWNKHRLIETQEAMARDTKCEACGRSAKAVFSSPPGGGIQFEIVQTGGSPLPSWMPPIRWDGGSGVSQ